MTERQTGTVGARAKGHVSSYRVLDTIPIDLGYHVVLEVDILRYKAPGIDTGNRRRLAILPFAAKVSEVDFFGPMHGADLASQVHSALVAQFVQSRRFSVLDRETAAVLDERAYIASQDAPISEKIKLGQTLAADYLVVGEIVDANASYDEKVGTLTGVVEDTSYAGLALSYRIIIPATGEIKFADNVELYVESNDNRSLSSRTGAINEISKDLVGIALDRIYPITVVQVTAEDEVVLNQGGITLTPGDQLVLVSQGEAITDPYTKEPLGRVESTIGTIEIIRSDGKLAYARAVGSSGVPLRKGLLARRSSEINMTATPAPSQRTEGVYLPFD